MPESGTIQVGDQKTGLRFARAIDTAGGRLGTVVASQPILHTGAGAGAEVLARHHGRPL